VLERSRAYVAAGADAIFPEAMNTPDEFKRCRAALDVPLVIDVPEWGRTPTFLVDELAEWGFDLAIFALSPMRVALAAARDFLADLAVERTQRPWLERMMTRAELDDLVGLPQIRADEDRLGVEAAATLRGLGSTTP
jgi:methylisocitrate lyase